MTYVVQCDMCNRVAARIEEIDICQFYLAKNCIGGVVSKCAISFVVPHCHNREALAYIVYIRMRCIFSSVHFQEDYQEISTKGRCTKRGP